MLLGREHSDKGDRDHADESGNEGDTKYPQANRYAVGRDGEDMCNYVFTHEPANKDKDGGKN